ncbi:MAG: RDD family protein [Lysobacteraceae bacterium]
MDTRPRPAAAPAHLVWRLLAMLYDSLPIFALWLAFSAIMLALRGGAPVVPWTPAFWLQAAALWTLTGAYLVFSWRRGGQTLGMRPWRLQLVGTQDARPGVGVLWQRHAWATLSLALGGLGFLWSLFDRERRSLHDLLSGTRLLRLPKPAKP